MEVVRRLAGASTGTLEVVRLAAGEQQAGWPEEAVLRRYTEPALLRRHPTLPADEARALRAVAGHGIPVPRLLDVDPDGTRYGVPSLLMTRLDGAPSLRPGPPAAADLDGWLDGLVLALAWVHAVPATEVAGLGPIAPWFDPADGRVPAWASHPEPWVAVAAAVRADPVPPAVEPVLVHRDLHPGNVLWVDGEVRGVVDWVNAGVGSPAADLARCRTNLAILVDLDVADELLVRYRRRTGRPLDDQRWWDLADLAGVMGEAVEGMGMVDAVVGASAALGAAVERHEVVAALEAHAARLTA